MISGGTPDLVADEAFVVLDMFCPLFQREVDSVNVHRHGVFGGFSMSKGWEVGGSFL